MLPATRMRWPVAMTEDTGDRPLLLVHFAALKDPRRHQHKVVYPLPLLLLIAFAAALCGLKDWEAAADFAEEKRDWLSKLWPLEGETPSSDTLERVFSRLDAKTFRRCLLSWMNAVSRARETSGLKHLAVDGKSVEGARDPRSPTVPLHLVHAFLVEHELLLGMEPCAGAPGEPQAVLRMLEVLELRGTVVTGDANMTTRAIADAVVARDGDYVFSLKGNRGPSHGEVVAALCAPDTDQLDDTVADRLAASTYDSGAAEGHGRRERRRGWTIPADNFPALKKLLPHAALLLALVRERAPTANATGVSTSKETSFYVTSLNASAEVIATLVRNHWRVENLLHRSLDVVLHEDSTRVAKSHAAENLATVRRAALAVLRSDVSMPGSAPKKMRHATFNDDYRAHLLRTVIS